jgi:NADPH:quinone reductase-like Zn-dependent oxidoreductase
MEVDYEAGYVHEVGEGVTRFKKGDGVLSMSALALRNDHRFGAHQRYALSVEALTAHVCPRLILSEKLLGILYLYCDIDW